MNDGGSAVPNYWTYDGSKLLLEDNNAGTEIRRYRHGSLVKASSLLLDVTAAYPAVDHRGSVVSLVAPGLFTDTLITDLFGNVVSSTNNLGDRLRFLGDFLIELTATRKMYVSPGGVYVASLGMGLVGPLLTGTVSPMIPWPPFWPQEKPRKGKALGPLVSDAGKPDVTAAIGKNTDPSCPDSIGITKHRTFHALGSTGVEFDMLCEPHDKTYHIVEDVTLASYWTLQPGGGYLKGDPAHPTETTTPPSKGLDKMCHGDMFWDVNPFLDQHGTDATVFQKPGGVVQCKQIYRCNKNEYVFYIDYIISYTGDTSRLDVQKSTKQKDWAPTAPPTAPAGVGPVATPNPTTKPTSPTKAVPGGKSTGSSGLSAEEEYRRFQHWRNWEQATGGKKPPDWKGHEPPPPFDRE